MAARQPQRETICFLGESGLAEWVFLGSLCLNNNFVIVPLRQTYTQSRHLALFSPLESTTYNHSSGSAMMVRIYLKSIDKLNVVIVCFESFLCLHCPKLWVL